MAEQDQKLAAGPVFSGLLWSPATWMRAALLFTGLFTLLLLHLPFYGDQATLVSAPALFYYEDGFSRLILPDALATGHPPLYALWIALLWTVFGKSLAIVHIWTGICVIFLLVQVNRLAALYLPDPARALLLLLVLCYPVLWAQAAGMSADVLITALVLYGFRCITEDRRAMLGVTLALLPLLSLRGWIWVFGLGLVTLYHHRASGRALLRYVPVFLLACLPVGLYFWLQFRAAGWFLMPPHGNWSEHRSLTDGRLLAGKSFEFALRCIEFGVMIPAILVATRLRHHLKVQKVRTAAVGMIAAFIAIGVFTLPFRGPILIRYLLPLHILILLLASNVLTGSLSARWRNICLAATILMMLASHFYAYPQMRRSVFEYSWGDGSLAHLGYFSYRAEAAAFLDEQGIPKDSIYTSFPEYKSFALTDLTDDTIGYRNMDTQSIATLPYVIYANNMNMVTNDMLQTLERTHTPLFERKGYPLHYTVYRRHTAAEMQN